MAQNDTIRTPSLKVGKDEVAGSNPAISSTCGRLLYYNGRPLLSGIVALNLMKLL